MGFYHDMSHAMLLLLIIECSESHMALAGPALGTYVVETLLLLLLLKSDRLINICVNTVIQFQLQSAG